MDIIDIGAAKSGAKKYTDEQIRLWLTSGATYKGTWNAETNTPTITQGVGTTGDYYEVKYGGRWDNTDFLVGDRIIFSPDGKWERIPTGREDENTPILIEYITETYSGFPTTRKSGKPLIFGDYIKVDTDATLPFDIPSLQPDGTYVDIHFDNYKDQAVWDGVKWVEDSAVLGDTSEVETNDKQKESYYQDDTLQKDVNITFNRKLKELYSYKQLIRLEKYAYSALYDDIDYEYANRYFEKNNLPVGSCSSIRNGNWYGRNYDWVYDEVCSFVVRTPHKNGRYATTCVCGNLAKLTDDFVTTKEFDDVYVLLPFCVLDGINEKKVVCNVNVLPVLTTPQKYINPAIKTEITLCSTMIPRYILDNFANATDAVNYLKNYVKIYFSKRIHEMNYEVHFMVADETKTYLVEFVNNETKIIDMTSGTSSYLQGKPYMTNFPLYGITLNDDGSVYTPETQDATHDAETTNKIHQYGAGLERYNLINSVYDTTKSKDGMRHLLNQLHYTKAYKTTTTPIWYTEFVGDDVTVKSKIPEFTETLTKAREMYNDRSRDPEDEHYGTWQSTHGSVYDIHNRTLYVCFQEGSTEHVFPFNFVENVEPIYYTDVVIKTTDWDTTTKQVTKVVNKILADSILVVEPYEEYKEKYGEYGIIAISQATNAVTFEYKEKPKEDIKLKLMLITNTEEI